MMKEKKSSTKFFVAGVVVILLAPFVPDFLINIIISDYSICSYKYLDIRLPEIIPSVRMFGIGLAIWSFILKLKED